MESIKTVLAIDPGNSKCGLALAQRDGEGKISLLWSSIAPKEQIPAMLEEAHRVAHFSMVIVGSGTTSKPLVAAIRQAMPSMAILVVDEKDTTLQARERYWEYNMRKGWRRFLPATLQVPPVPIDDYAALIIAERVLIA